MLRIYFLNKSAIFLIICLIFEIWQGIIRCGQKLIEDFAIETKIAVDGPDLAGLKNEILDEFHDVLTTFDDLVR